MSQEILAHVFEPFFTTKTLARGSGLGLPVVYGIVKQSGGQIRIQSELGKGTRVEVLLARALPPAAAEPIAVGGVANAIVLLVEDEDVVRKVVARILERAGYRVLVASGGAEALALYERTPTPIDALVSDVVMPGMSGKELADHLVGRRPSLKVLLMTGYTDDEFLRRGILDEGRAMVLKPFSPRDLLEVLRDLLKTCP
jgi:CheY-like chemotaxis protein